MFKKIVLLVLDSVGIGELPDASYYGDNGSNTLRNIIRKMGGLDIPHLVRLGIGNIQGLDITYNTDNPLACYGKAAEKSKGKDTTTGHWEIAGIVLNTPFPVYPQGFPKSIIDAFIQQTGRGVLCNRPASGSDIIQQLGAEHLQTGKLIVYTSADSVFQIAAHEDVIPVETLYDYCRIARKILTGEHAVGRVIARPFTGGPENFTRTSNRKDFSLEPVGITILDMLSNSNLETIGVGKIGDIFSYRGLTRIVPTKNNAEGVKETIQLLKEDFTGLIFTNLVDFDMLYGHRNDVEGYANALEAFDCQLPNIMNAMGPDDVLIITADHGCDPTNESTDHTREYIPVLAYGQSIKRGIDLGILTSYSDIGATILDLFSVDSTQINGISFKQYIEE